MLSHDFLDGFPFWMLKRLGILFEFAMRHPHRLALLTAINRNLTFHSGVGDFLMRTRFGRRSSSKRCPQSSFLTSTKSPNTVPKPRTNMAIA